MPARKPTARIYLFHGSDSFASTEALYRWEQVFLTKYGDTTKYVVNADELTPEQLQKKLTELTGGSVLFAEPKLLIIKRAATLDRGRSTTYSKALLTVLEQLRKQADPTLTTVVWEERQLAESNPLLQWFKQYQESGEAAFTTYQVPSASELLAKARKQLARDGYALDRTAEHWLIRELGKMEKRQRLKERLRATESLSVDERSWWLHQLLEIAVLRASAPTITEALLADIYSSSNPISVFELVNALGAEKIGEARRLFQDWQATGDEGDYFGLYALLRNQYRRLNNYYPLKLLAEIEVISKNFPLEHRWLFELFLIRLEQKKNGEKHSLFPTRTLWLASLPRS